MKPDVEMEAIIGGKRYRVSTAELLASDAYWDGHNFERKGRNTFLYRTPNGRYFKQIMTTFQGERSHLEALEPDVAKQLWEELPEQEMSIEEAFPGTEIEEA